jgi:hypothetical protein
MSSDHPETWSVSKIKEVLTQHHVDHSACVEKEVSIICFLVQIAQELLELLHRLPEYKAWSVPHHPDSHDQTSHQTTPHYYDNASSEGTPAPKQETKPAPTHGTHTAHTAHVSTEDHPENWSVSKIKQVLSQHKVDHSACVEKEVELHACLTDSQPGIAPTFAYSTRIQGLECTPSSGLPRTDLPRCLTSLL